MKVTIDQAGRVVVPKRLRDQVGITAGEVEMIVDGSGIRLEPVAGSGVVERDGWWVIDTDIPLTDEDVRTLRTSDQR
ncbi:MAG: AbrB/MazE/SpoVT family DNA-binding domain-containing protein [Phycicoccus sp.]